MDYVYSGDTVNGTLKAAVLLTPLSVHVRLYFCTDTATTQIFTLSLHDALPISGHAGQRGRSYGDGRPAQLPRLGHPAGAEQDGRSEEHTSELQSRENLVCRLLLEKKNEYSILTSSSDIVFCGSRPLTAYLTVCA